MSQVVCWLACNTNNTGQAVLGISPISIVRVSIILDLTLVGNVFGTGLLDIIMMMRSETRRLLLLSWDGKTQYLIIWFYLMCGDLWSILFICYINGKCAGAYELFKVQPTQSLFSFISIDKLTSFECLNDDL